ncbi:uncharacterized protein LOC111898582 isoform X2 [Lactuca sativa]|uniref:uncharacterized protein LOC111898582 isoform X2 n=1 Tax=Lactuca sativa TaxID=4236 RepID=UPI001C68EF83|nr:uncharacterized protein LOC111898582 isoform X2 [Lactuca sativa]
MVLLRIGTPHNYKLFTRIIILKIMLFPILERISVNQKYMLMHRRSYKVTNYKVGPPFCGYRDQRLNLACTCYSGKLGAGILAEAGPYNAAFTISGNGLR